MSVIRTAGRVVIEAPAAVAWTVLGDYANDPLWRAGVSRMVQEPAGMVRDGATAVEDLTVLGRRVTTRIELLDVRAGSGFAWRAIDGTTAHGTRTLTPLGEERCELRTEREIRLTGADRILRPLVAWVMGRTERADMRRAAMLVQAREA